MKTYCVENLHEYMQSDWILDLLEREREDAEMDIRTNSWLFSMENKRMIYSDMYGDILKGERNFENILDIGGGYNSLTKILARNSRYELLDFLAHGGDSYIRQQARTCGFILHEVNWYDFVITHEYDLIIANDIFPDVDQRVELFLDKFLPHCRELRILLTFYNKPCFYTTRRVDDSEMMTFLSWDGEILALKLRKYMSVMDASCEEIEGLAKESRSIYWNGRNVCYAKFRGGLA